MLKQWVFFLLLGSVMVSALYAKGTAAGTSVANQAAISYTLGGTEYNLTTNSDQFIVDQVIDLALSWQDMDPVEVGADETERVLTFILANQGNGEDSIVLTYEHNDSSDFAPLSAALFVDSNGNGYFDAGADHAISDLNLSADTNVTLFIVSTIPDDNTTVPGAYSYDAITARSTAVNTEENDHQESIDTVIRTGSDRDEGAYVIRDYWLVSQKSAIVHSEDNQTHTGTVITYRIELFIGGNADGRSIEDVVVEDGIPAGTMYQPDSLRLDNASLTDAADADKGAFADAKIHVEIGTLSGSTHQVVTFDVQVQ